LENVGIDCYWAEWFVIASEFCELQSCGWTLDAARADTSTGNFVIYQITIMFTQYTSGGGSTVHIPSRIDPFDILGVDLGASAEQVKAAFRSRIFTENRQQRANVSLAYAIVGTLSRGYQLPPFFRQITNKTFEYASDPIVMTYTGDWVGLKKAIEANRSVVHQTAEGNCSLLYLAARSGFRDVIEVLLTYGADINAQGNGSSALHAASYFRHECIVEQLLALGASVSLTNKFGHLPIDEAGLPGIKKLILNANHDVVAKLLHDVTGLSVAGDVETILLQRRPVGYRVIRRLEDRQNIISRWKLGWHGTTQSSVLSIFGNGLKKPETKVGGITVMERDGHVRRGVTVTDVPDWSLAVFVSPILTYAACSSYAEKLNGGADEGKWCVIIQAYVRQGSFQRHGSTVWSYDKKPGTNEEEEMRVDPGADESVVNQGHGVQTVCVSRGTNVVVAGLLLVNNSFLKETTMSCRELNEMMLGSDMIPSH
jgi:hypothetical protein